MAKDIAAFGRNSDQQELAHQLKLWALTKRKPWVHLLLEAIREFLPPLLVGVPKGKRPAEWLHTRFVRKNRESLQGYEHRLKLLGPLPSFQEGVSTLDLLRRQLGCSPLTSTPLHEMRYPYLDRNLLEFLFAVPRQQLVRPHQRRSLMRRALASIVPVEILSRRKAFVSRAPLNLISLEWPRVFEMSQCMLLAELGIVEPNRFSLELERARDGAEVATVLLMRAFTVEAWLKHVSGHRILAGSTLRFAESLKGSQPAAISAENK